MNVFPPNSPASDAHSYHDLISRLQNAKIFRDYQQAFQIATGLPLALRPETRRFISGAPQRIEADQPFLRLDGLNQ
jgi:hypothetical protein